MSEQQFTQADQEQVIQKPPTYERIFHQEGAFIDGSKIQKSFFWGAERWLVVTNSGVADTVSAYKGNQEKYRNSLPQQELFPNGLSREQAVRTMAALEAIIGFNGGIPDEHVEQRNAKVYTKGEDVQMADGEADLIEFKGKKAMTCIEMSTMAQQVLSADEQMTQVSGAARWEGLDQYEAHTFNLIATSDPEKPVAVLDMINPIRKRLDDGTVQLKLYCAPMTPQQVEEFKQGKPVNLDYGDEQRTYFFGMSPDSPFKFSW